MEENKILVLKLVVICGKNFYYPQNETAMTVLNLTKSTSRKRKTLTDEDLENLTKLGFQFKILKPRISYE